MIHTKLNKKNPKGWYAGPWNSKLPVAVGYANEGINETHYHAKMYEVYLVARGKSTAVVNGKKILLKAGDMLAIEPQEVHTFVKSSKEYLHFVLHCPFVKGDKILTKELPNKQMA